LQRFFFKGTSLPEKFTVWAFPEKEACNNTVIIKNPVNFIANPDWGVQKMRT
jgi:hypothetical protein